MFYVRRLFTGVQAATLLIVITVGSSFTTLFIADSRKARGLFLGSGPLFLSFPFHLGLPSPWIFTHPPLPGLQAGRSTITPSRVVQSVIFSDFRTDR
jgi:hypothetical protein